MIVLMAVLTAHQEMHEAPLLLPSKRMSLLACTQQCMITAIVCVCRHVRAGGGADGAAGGGRACARLVPAGAGVGAAVDGALLRTFPRGAALQRRRPPRQVAQVAAQWQHVWVSHRKWSLATKPQHAALRPLPRDTSFGVAGLPSQAAGVNTNATKRSHQ